jgi:sugar lactone lactonase YvrE
MVRKMIKRTCLGAATATLLLAPLSLASFAADLRTIEVPGERAYPESISAASDGTLYVSSFASGGVFRVKPGATKAEEWIKPAAFGTRSIFGVLVDEKAGVLWVCSNDISAIGVPGPGSATGSHLMSFDLATGEGKASVELPGQAAICNDIARAPDGTLFVTNSLAPQILRLGPGQTTFEIWVEDAQFEQPDKGGAGLDGIAIGDDGNIYVNNYTTGSFFRVAVKGGAASPVTKLNTSRALKNPDGLRPAGGGAFIMAEGGTTVDRVTIKGDHVEIETLKGDLTGPTGVALVGNTLWTTEGQLSHLFDPKAGPPRLPFRVVGTEMQK